MPKYIYVRASGVRAFLKEKGKRCGGDFLYALDKYLQEKLATCCEREKVKTLDVETVKTFLQ